MHAYTHVHACMWIQHRRIHTKMHACIQRKCSVNQHQMGPFLKHADYQCWWLGQNAFKLRAGEIFEVMMIEKRGNWICKPRTSGQEKDWAQIVSKVTKACYSRGNHSGQQYNCSVFPSIVEGFAAKLLARLNFIHTQKLERRHLLPKHCRRLAAKAWSSKSLWQFLALYQKMVALNALR